MEGEENEGSDSVDKSKCSHEFIKTQMNWIQLQLTLKLHSRFNQEQEQSNESLHEINAKWINSSERIHTLSQPYLID